MNYRAWLNSQFIAALNYSVTRRLPTYPLNDGRIAVAHQFGFNNKTYYVRAVAPDDRSGVAALVDRAYREERLIAQVGALADGFVANKLLDAPLPLGLILIDGNQQIAGFLQYSYFRSYLQARDILRLEYIYVIPEHRSFCVFRAMLATFEDVGGSLSCDAIRFGFDTGIDIDRKRQMLERTGYERTGSFLTKVLPVHDDTQPLVTQASIRKPSGYRASFAGLWYFWNISRQRVPDFILFMLVLHWRLSTREKNGFAQFQQSDRSRFLFAQVDEREEDGLRIAVVDALHHPTAEMLANLELWAKHHECRLLVVDPIEAIDDATMKFPDHVIHGYQATGHIMTKPVRKGTVPND
jgi:hypothetical protein